MDDVKFPFDLKFDHYILSFNIKVNYSGTIFKIKCNVKSMFVHCNFFNFQNFVRKTCSKHSVIYNRVKYPVWYKDNPENYQDKITKNRY